MTISERITNQPSLTHSYERWIICGYVMFSVVMIATIYLTSPAPDAADTSVAITMTLP
ncbi:hypothetical protein BRAS3843_470022 [Bradyrhizobium sp. STM 3843]|uniref:hypothetical protein n=1 Tax=Bradyrhizobium sp. STM 3843 TaxID=551947 RepID=UPI0002403D40|nr:hypothetical protein [Bradyrhizobium sp. STM 3843]CCE10326.1 hypothetical protein BRAS3843_470022 [Bradyrhizobium sp. STM 3843]